MRYEIMGTPRLLDNEGYTTIGARKIEILLVTLLIRYNRIVPIDQLITEIWDTAPPRRATAALHVYISQLRKFLNRPGRGDSAIITRSGGYVLQLGTDETDFHDFQALMLQGREKLRKQHREDAVTLLQSALDLWREPALGDLHDGPITNGFATWLRELHLECIELLTSTNLMLGRHKQLIGFLRTLINDHPLHEEFYRQLMLALYRADRRADALNVYQSAREVLRRELGLEPCRALQDMQHTILNAERTHIDPHLTHA
jgi:DNA-binding SARP family transcriptional activator